MVSQKFKNKVKKKVEATKQFTKKTLNINKYNKWLFIFETILFIGVADEFFEGLIMKANFNIYLNIILLMLSIGVLFTLAFKLIEPMTRNAIVWIVRSNSNKILRVLVHIVILYTLFHLYGKVFYGTNIGIVFKLALSAN